MARKATKKIAFLGLGRMGGLMTKHLLDAGFEVMGYDPAPKAVAAAKKNGAKIARTVAAAVKGVDVVCSSLPKNRHRERRLPGRRRRTQGHAARRGLF